MANRHGKQFESVYLEERFQAVNAEDSKITEQREKALDTSFLLPPMPVVSKFEIEKPLSEARSHFEIPVSRDVLHVMEMAYRFEGGGDGRGRASDQIPVLREWWRFLGFLLTEPEPFVYQLQFIKETGSSKIPAVFFLVKRAGTNGAPTEESFRTWHNRLAGQLSRLAERIPFSPMVKSGSPLFRKALKWSNLGEFFPRERLTHAGNYQFHPWRVRTENMATILEELALFSGEIAFTATLSPKPITEKEKAYLFANGFEDHRFLHGTERLFDMRVHLVADRPFTSALVQAIGATVAGQEGPMINAEEGPIDQPGQDRGGFAFEEALSDFEVQAARANILAGTTIQWEPSVAPFDLQRVRRLVTPVKATSFRPPIGSAWQRFGGASPRLSPPPLPDLPLSGIKLGVIHHCGTQAEIRQPESDAFLHSYVVGKTGTGKSTLLLNLALQRIQEGHGVTLVDPHGDLAWDLLSHIPPGRMEDVIVFDPTDIHFPMGFNLIEVDTRYPEQKTLLINELLEIFNLLYDMRHVAGPIFELYFRNSLLVLMESGQPYDITMLPRVMTDDKYRNELLEKCGNPLVVRFWKDEVGTVKEYNDMSIRNITPYITSKLNAFIYNDFIYPIVTQQKSAFAFSDILANRKIMIVRLNKGRLGKSNAFLLGAVLVSKLFMAAMARTDLPVSERTPHYLFLDEFHNLTTPTVADMLSEARKFGLAVVLANQHLDQVQPETRAAICGNVATQVSFRLGPLDSKLMATSLGNPDLSQTLIDLPNYQTIVRLSACGRGLKPFQMQTLDPPQHPDDRVRQLLIDYSRAFYAKPREEVLKKWKEK